MITTFPLTHAVIARDAKGALHLMETPIGLALDRCIAELADGDIVGGSLTLVRVERQDRDAGLIIDVTKAVLMEVAVACEADNRDAPESLHEAFAACCVARPVVLPEGEDPDAEHRLTAHDVGVMTRRAA